MQAAIVHLYNKCAHGPCPRIVPQGYPAMYFDEHGHLIRPSPPPAQEEYDRWLRFQSDIRKSEQLKAGADMFKYVKYGVILSIPIWGLSVVPAAIAVGALGKADDLLTMAAIRANPELSESEKRIQIGKEAVKFYGGDLLGKIKHGPADDIAIDVLIDMLP